jgi:hypothetical protein
MPHLLQYSILPMLLGCDFVSSHKYTNLQNNIREQFLLDGVFCIFVVFQVVLLAHGLHKCANVQMIKYVQIAVPT